MATLPLEEVLTGCPKTQQQQERKPRPQPEQALKCPRCDSTNTKFCYYNNYSLSQPRYFCKGCRRYWTKGGSLRNVPVGGGCRKNKRSSTTSKRAQDQALATNSNPPLPTLLPPPFSYDPSDLSLAFARLHKPPTAGQLGLDDHDSFLLGNPNPNPAGHIPTATPGFLDILRGGFLDTATNGFHSLYYGFGAHGSVEKVEDCVAGVEPVLPFDAGLSGATTTTSASTPTTSQGSCKAADGPESKMFMGLQWQVGGDGNMAAMDPGRDYWNGVGSSWPGLLNSSLM